MTRQVLIAFLLSLFPAIATPLPYPTCPGGYAGLSLEKTLSAKNKHDQKNFPPDHLLPPIYFQESNRQKTHLQAIGRQPWQNQNEAPQNQSLISQKIKDIASSHTDLMDSRKTMEKYVERERLRQFISNGNRK
jgi:hypothetical protein